MDSRLDTDGKYVWIKGDKWTPTPSAFKCPDRCIACAQIEWHDISIPHDVIVQNELLGVMHTDSPTTWL